LVSLSIPEGALAVDQPTSLAISAINAGTFSLGGAAQPVMAATFEPSGPGIFAPGQTATIGFTWPLLPGDQCLVNVPGSPLREGKLLMFYDEDDDPGTAPIVLTKECRYPSTSGDRCPDRACAVMAPGMCTNAPCASACCDTAANEFKVAVNHFSTYIVGVPACAAAEKPKILVGRVDTPPGDDRLTFKGQVALSTPITPALDPLTNGVQIVIEDTAATLVDLLIPGGAFDAATGIGWKVRGRPPSKWTYVNKSTTPPLGIQKVVVQDDSTAAPGRVKFVAKGRDGDYAAFTANPPLLGMMALDGAAGDDGHCADLAFPGAPGAACAFTKSGAAFRCR
jgi:hypothetical protein